MNIQKTIPHDMIMLTKNSRSFSSSSYFANTNIIPRSPIYKKITKDKPKLSRYNNIDDDDYKVINPILDCHQHNISMSPDWIHMFGSTQIGIPSNMMITSIPHNVSSIPTVTSSSNLDKKKNDLVRIQPNYSLEFRNTFHNNIENIKYNDDNSSLNSPDLTSKIHEIITYKSIFTMTSHHSRRSLTEASLDIPYKNINSYSKRR